MKKILEIIHKKNDCYNYYINPHIEEDDGRGSYLCADFQRWAERYLKNILIDFNYFGNEGDNEDYCKRCYRFYLYFKMQKEAVDFCKSLSKQDEDIVVIYLDKVI